MTNQQPTCKDRINQKLRERIAEFEEALKAEEQMQEEERETFKIDGNEYEGFIEWLNERALSYADDPCFRAKVLLLTWGGPSDYFLFFTELDRIEYHYQDWFDGAKRELQGHDYEIMRQVYERITE